MKTQEAIDYFGSIRKTAEALRLTVQAVYAWGEFVPQLRAYQINEIKNAGRADAAQTNDQDRGPQASHKQAA